MFRVIYSSTGRQIDFDYLTEIVENPASIPYDQITVIQIAKYRIEKGKLSDAEITDYSNLVASALRKIREKYKGVFVDVDASMDKIYADYLTCRLN